jgi:phage replication-related protein YjqB (UPF0714/DUF867 family)
MADKYGNFAELEKHERRGRDFRTRLRDRGSEVVIIAPHAGDIEPGTSEIAEAIAGDDLSFYLFEGIKVHRNRYLHITSHRFDEPRCVALVEASTRAIGVHGLKGEGQVIQLGGRDLVMIRALRKALMEKGFHVKPDPRPSVEGRCRQNICNRCASKLGIQIELSRGLRRSFFKGPLDAGRRRRTRRFREFVTTVRNFILASPESRTVAVTRTIGFPLTARRA